MGKGFISALLFWKLKILRQKYFHRKPRISVWEGCPAVAQSACPTDLRTYASLGREGDKTHFYSNKHKKATKEVINVSSCILLCCLSKLQRGGVFHHKTLETACTSLSIPAAAI